MSMMKPADGDRSLIRTALMSVAALGSWPLMVCTPLIGIRTTRSSGVFVGLRIPTTVNTSACCALGSYASP
jgi:hypothetical protein